MPINARLLNGYVQKAAAWTNANEVLAPNEEGVESDTGRSKVGDGATHWNSLPYQDALTGGRIFAAILPTEIPLTVKGAALQTANLLEAKNSADTLLSFIGEDGSLNINDLGTNVRKIVLSKILGSAGILFQDWAGGAGTYEIGEVGGKVRHTLTNTGAGLEIALSGTSTIFSVSPNDTEALRVDNSVTAGQTRLLVYDVDNATLERVTVGAVDSGGAGFKTLRIPN